MIELPSLYAHQVDIVNDLKRAFCTHRANILQAAPGMGKTRTSKWIIGQSANRDIKPNQTGNVLFAVHRRSLVDNASDSFCESPELPHGVIMSGRDTDWSKRVQVASIDSLLSWHVETDKYLIDHTFDMVVFDECHSHISKLIKWLRPHDERRKQLGLMPTFVLGLSATPEAKELPGLFGSIVHGPTTEWLIEQGFLSPFRYVRATQGRLDKLKMRAGEFTSASQDEAMQGLAGDLVRDWLKFAQGRPTVGFFHRLAYAREARDILRAAGIRAEDVDGQTPDEVRRQRFRDLADGTIQYLCNVGVVERGTNIPEISCVDLCLSIGSRKRYLQMIGRGSRTCEGKTDCLARGTLVLTHRGQVPIEEVCISDKVWDGNSFVSHGGSICKGKQDVITYLGLTATPDHKVKTKEGWRSFGDCASQQIPIVQTGLDGQEIRERSGCFARNRMAWKWLEKAAVFASSMRNMLARVVGVNGQPDWWENDGLPKMQPAKTIPKMAMAASHRPAATMPERKSTCVRQIWRTRNTVRFLNSCGGVSVDYRQPRIGQDETDRPDRQRRSLRAGESSVVNTTPKSVEHSPNKAECRAAQVPRTTPGNSLRRLYDSWLYRFRSFVRSNRISIPQREVTQTKREVWDILESGPLHCFTAQGLLVHNCLVIDHGGNIKGKHGHGFFEDDHEWTLDNSKKETGEVGIKPTIECPKCQTVYRGGKCRVCDYEPVRSERESQGLDFDGTELKEIKRSDSKATKKQKTCEEIMISALYMAGRSGRTWKQCLGIAYGIAKSQGTRFRVPRDVTVGGKTYRMLPYGSPDSSRRVKHLYDFV